MGYMVTNPPGLGTYPTIETSRTLRWSALEECGVRQVGERCISCCPLLVLSGSVCPANIHLLVLVGMKKNG